MALNNNTHLSYQISNCYLLAGTKTEYYISHIVPRKMFLFLLKLLCKQHSLPHTNDIFSQRALQSKTKRLLENKNIRNRSILHRICQRCKETNNNSIA